MLDRTDFILGRDVALFEEAFAAYCEVKYAVGVDSGTSALEMALRAYGIGPGDEVITAANTFIATVLAIAYVGARPVLVDVDPRTYTLDPLRLASAITPQTKAIIPVHLYGQPADMDPIMGVRQHGLIVIEDAWRTARATKGRGSGRSSRCCIQLLSRKNLGAYGDGGMALPTTNGSPRRFRCFGTMGRARNIVTS